MSELVSMGFSAEVARHALMRYNNDNERALDWLLNVGEAAAAAAAAAAGGGGGAASGGSAASAAFNAAPHELYRGTTTQGGSAAPASSLASTATPSHTQRDDDDGDWMARLQVTPTPPHPPLSFCILRYQTKTTV